RLALPREVDVGGHTVLDRVGSLVGTRADGFDRIGQVGDVDGGGDQAGRTRTAGVFGDHHGAAGDLPRVHRGQPTVAVVAAGQHFQERGVVAPGATDPLPDQPDQRLGTGHHGLDSFIAVRCLRVVVQPAQVTADRG